MSLEIRKEPHWNNDTLTQVLQYKKQPSRIRILKEASWNTKRNLSHLPTTLLPVPSPFADKIVLCCSAQTPVAVGTLNTPTWIPSEHQYLYLHTANVDSLIKPLWIASKRQVHRDQCKLQPDQDCQPS